jgi:hypothetical protein
MNTLLPEADAVCLQSFWEKDTQAKRIKSFKKQQLLYKRNPIISKSSL